MTAKRQVSLTLGVDNLEFMRMSWKRVPPLSLRRADEPCEPSPLIPSVTRKEFPWNFHRGGLAFKVPFL